MDINLVAEIFEDAIDISRRAPVQFAVSEGNVHLRIVEANHEARLFQVQQMREHPAGDVDRVAHRVGADAQTARITNFFEAIEIANLAAKNT